MLNFSLYFSFPTADIFLSNPSQSPLFFPQNLRLVTQCFPTKSKLCFLEIMDKFGSEAWVLKKREEQRLEAAQMKFSRHLLGITKLDKEKNQCIREKTGAQNIVKEIKQYQEKWLQHIQRMDTNRIPKQTLQYKPKGRRHIGRPRKRWRDQFHFEDTRNRNQT